jgi:hypothetical protein
MIKCTNFLDVIDDGNIPDCDLLEHVHYQRGDTILSSYYNFSFYLLQKNKFHK